MSPEDDYNENEFFEGEEEENSIHTQLRESSDELYRLASFCEQNFKDYEEAVNRNITLEDAKVNGAFGSKEIEQTGDFAVQALNSIAYNINILAINLEAKLDQVSVAVRDVSTNVSQLANYTEMYQKKVDMKHFKEQLSVKDEYNDSGKRYLRLQKVDVSSDLFEFSREYHLFEF